MLSQLNMSIAMSLPLKKRPIRTDFSNIEELANIPTSKRFKRESTCSESPRSGRCSTESSSSTASSSSIVENHLRESAALFPFASHFYQHSTFIPPLHRNASLSFPYGFNVPTVATEKWSLPIFRDNISPEPTVKVCHECGKGFTSKTRYRAHLRRHSSKTSGRYQCKECDKNFVQRSSLTTHMRIHTGERPYKCSDCSVSFGDYSTYTKHQRTHTGEKPYPCPVCDRRFSQSGNMHRHLKSVHHREHSSSPL